MRSPRLQALFVSLVVLAWASVAAAEPVVLTVEGAAALPLGAPQTDRFGPGGSVAAGALLSMIPQLQLGVRLRGVALFDKKGNDQETFANPGLGTLENLSLALRIRPLAGSAERRALGLFLEGTAGYGFTGDLLRPSVGGALGWGIDAGSYVVAPVLRFSQILQPDGELSGEDAKILMAGVELAFNDQVAPVAAIEEPIELKPEPVADRDGDGVPDEDDVCPDEPEDLDGFEDSNGCPDTDNDGDEILDVEDSCPMEPEDVDNFADEDGCPDPDNDDDGFLDADDSCPNEPEIVNGNKDFDGCPDKGLITMVDDRIVLEERVLFDLERARIKRVGRPVLRAIVNLVSQHPEWIKIRIEGHADARGDQEYNQALSQRRADNVRKELVSLGLPPEPIEAVGYGATRPRDKRDDAESHRRNRRVEFVVVARRAAGSVAEDAPQELGDRGALEAASPATAAPDAAQQATPPAQEEATP